MPHLIFLPVAEALDIFARLNNVTNAVAMVGGLAVVSGLWSLRAPWLPAGDSEADGAYEGKRDAGDIVRPT